MSQSGATKFPKEDYERLMDAYEEGDKKLIEKAYSTFESNVTAKAKIIRKSTLLHPTLPILQ